MDTIAYIPVGGATDSDGTVLALKGLIVDNPEQVDWITPPSVPSVDSCNVLQSGAIQASVSAMLALGFRGFAMAAKMNATYFVVDIVKYATVPAVTGGPVNEWYFGYGHRIGIQGFNASGTAAASVAGLAGSATMSGTATSYQVKSFGIPYENVMPLLLPLAGQMLGGLNMGTIQQMGVVREALANYSITQLDNITPQLIGYSLVNNPDGLDESAASLGFGLRAIEKGLSYTDASGKNAKHNAPVAPAIFKPLYEEILGSGYGDDVVPNSAQRQQAKELLEMMP
ncbi:hypothetical protein KUV95_12190 [Microbulbifer agarilyticus]|uniref:hypothetical protein n=1 Tax=Microbulbifer agarilyticus TaxID=260552 RepID=UPI001C9468C8|nr:hypothetical protein [Microbulbifer agarilyticus]MBY6212311.1 hypothetical protein [Microbulbifer agarilyticus]MCA0901468.1 hypothetical protein [Microbulbifer agarilyticus]